MGSILLHRQESTKAQCYIDPPRIRTEPIMSEPLESDDFAYHLQYQSIQWIDHKSHNLKSWRSKYLKTKIQKSSVKMCSLRSAGVVLLLLSSCVMVNAADKTIFVEGAPLVGGSNGMFFDAENKLDVARLLGRAITKIDPETGDIISHLGIEDSVIFPIDVIIAPDGTHFWTDNFVATIGRRPPGGPSEFLYEPGTYPSVNALTLSDDGTRLFFGQCVYEDGLNGIFELNLLTHETTVILDDVPFCASNAMDYRNESLFTPRTFEGRIVQIDLANSNTVTNVTINLGIPVAVKFDSQGRLFALDRLNGQVLRIDIGNPDPTSNSELVAQFPFDGVDNLAFDKDDRLYVSSLSTGRVTEVLGMSDFRSVSPGDMTVTSGIAYIGGIIYTVSTLAMYGYDVQTAEQVTFVESMPGFGPLNQPTAVVAMYENLALLSFVSNILMVWDVNTNSALFTATGFEAPMDAHPFQGGMLVTEATTGNIVNATGPNLATRMVIANLPGSFFLAGNDSDVYTSNFITGTIVKVIANGLVLDPPEEVATRTPRELLL
jgi:hypothetical protein